MIKTVHYYSQDRQNIFWKYMIKMVDLGYKYYISSRVIFHGNSGKIGKIYYDNTISIFSYVYFPLFEKERPSKK